MRCEQELVVLLWKLMDGSPRFAAFIATQDCTRVVVSGGVGGSACAACGRRTRPQVPLLYLCFTSREAVSRTPLVHVCTFVLLVRPLGAAALRSCSYAFSNAYWYSVVHFSSAARAGARRRCRARGASACSSTPRSARRSRWTSLRLSACIAPRGGGARAVAERARHRRGTHADLMVLVFHRLVTDSLPAFAAVYNCIIT